MPNCNLIAVSHPVSFQRFGGAFSAYSICRKQWHRCERRSSWRCCCWAQDDSETSVAVELCDDKQPGLRRALSKGRVQKEGRISGGSSPQADENVQPSLPQSSHSHADSYSRAGHSTAAKAQCVPLFAKHALHTAGKAVSAMQAPYRSIHSRQAAVDSAPGSMAKGGNPFARVTKQKASLSASL